GRPERVCPCSRRAGRNGRANAFGWTSQDLFPRIDNVFRPDPYAPSRDQRPHAHDKPYLVPRGSELTFVQMTIIVPSFTSRTRGLRLERCDSSGNSRLGKACHMLFWILSIVVGVLLSLVIVILAVGSSLPREHVVTRSLTLAQSPETVWSVVTDFAGQST